jgi:2-aminoethylphosphonate-pyruvate transaminase
MRAQGFRVFLDAAIQAPIIYTFHAPADPAYEFKRFYGEVRDRGFILYPGKLTQLETFRVGCIGAITPADMRAAVLAIGDALRAMGIRTVTPAVKRAAA